MDGVLPVSDGPDVLFKSTGSHAVSHATPQSTRERILRATRRVLADRGLRATVQEVADAAEVSRRTVFRYFPKREDLLVAALEVSMRSYEEHIPHLNEGDVGEWLVQAMTAVHRMNLRHGRVYWELALSDDVPPELFRIAVSRRANRREFVQRLAFAAWQRKGGVGHPPSWLEDTFAVQSSAFAAEALRGDFGRSAEEIGQSAAKALAAALEQAIKERGPQ